MHSVCGLGSKGVCFGFLLCAARVRLVCELGLGVYGLGTVVCFNKGVSVLLALLTPSKIAACKMFRSTPPP